MPPEGDGPQEPLEGATAVLPGALPAPAAMQQGVGEEAYVRADSIDLQDVMPAHQHRTVEVAGTLHVEEPPDLMRASSADLMRQLDVLCQQHQRAVREHVDHFFAQSPSERVLPKSIQSHMLDSDLLQRAGPSWREAVKSAGVGDFAIVGRTPSVQIPKKRAAESPERSQQAQLVHATPSEPPDSSPATPLSHAASKTSKNASSAMLGDMSPKKRDSFKRRLSAGQTHDSLESNLDAEINRLTAHNNDTKTDLVSRMQRGIKKTRGKSILHGKSSLQALDRPHISLTERLQIITSNWIYEVGGALMIVLNAFVIAWEAQYAAEKAALGLDGKTTYFQAFGGLFCFIFAVDLLFRLIAQGLLAFFLSEERWWNLIDTVVVVSFLIDVVLEAADADSAGVDFSLLRVIRLLRVVRVLRVLRNFSYMRDMRIMVSMLCSAVVPLTWIIIIMFSVCMTFAIFFTDASATYLRPRSESQDPGLADLKHYFGDLPRSIASLYMSITGGVDWEVVANSLSLISGWYVVAFYAFIAFSSFAMLNVISAIFIDTTIQRSKNDRDFVIQTEMEGKRDFIRTMDILFLELDQDGSGEISLEELQSHMLVPKVEAYFKALDLDVSQAKKLFKLMDLDNSGTISREEFIVGASRLRGEAKELDVAILQYEIKGIKSLVVTLGLHLDEHFSRLANTSA